MTTSILDIANRSKWWKKYRRQGIGFLVYYPSGNRKQFLLAIGNWISVEHLEFKVWLLSPLGTYFWKLVSDKVTVKNCITFNSFVEMLYTTLWPEHPNVLQKSPNKEPVRVFFCQMPPKKVLPYFLRKLCLSHHIKICK